MAEYLFRRRHTPRWQVGQVPPDTERAASGFQSQPRPARRSWVHYAVLLLSAIPPIAAAAAEDLPEGSFKSYGRGDVVARHVPNVRIGGGVGADREVPVGNGLSHVTVPARRASFTAFRILPTGAPPDDAAAAEALPEGRYQFQDRRRGAPVVPFRFPGVALDAGDIVGRGFLTQPGAADRPRAAALRSWITGPPLDEVVSIEALPEGTVRFYGRVDTRPRLVPNVRMGGGAGADREAPVGRGFQANRFGRAPVPHWPYHAPFWFPGPPEAAPAGATRYYLLLALTSSFTPIAPQDLPPGLGSQTARAAGTRPLYGRPLLIGNVPFAEGEVPAGLGSQTHVAPGRSTGARRLYGLPLLIGSVPAAVIETPAAFGFQTGRADGVRRFAGRPLLAGSYVLATTETPTDFGFQTDRAPGRARSYGQAALLAAGPMPDIETPAGTGYLELRWGGWLGALRAAPSAYWTLPIFVPPPDFVEPPEPPALPAGEDIRGSRWYDITGRVWDDVRGSRWLDTS